MQIIMLIFLLSCSLYGAEIAWERDYTIALEKSASQGKPLLLFFTGSDCSGWGMKLKNEILAAKDFIEKTEGKFIFVEIDFPEHKAVDAKLAQKNEELRQKWKVTQIPRMILVDDEREIARFGSTSLSAGEFAEDLLSIVAKDKKLSKQLKSVATLHLGELEELYKLARELERDSDAAVILSDGAERGGSFFLTEQYRLLVEGGKSEGPEAKQLRGRLVEMDDKKVALSLALIDFQRLSNGEHTDAHLTMAPLEGYLKKYPEDRENLWRLEMMIAQFYVDQDEWKQALQHAERACAQAPEMHKEEIAKSVDYIRGELVIVDSRQ